MSSSTSSMRPCEIMKWGLSGTYRHARGMPNTSGMTHARRRLRHQSGEGSTAWIAIPAAHTNISPTAKAMPARAMPRTPRSLAGVSSTMIDTDTGSLKPTAKPTRVRRTMSQMRSGAKDEAAADATNSTPENSSVFRRPHTSPRNPPTMVPRMNPPKTTPASMPSCSCVSPHSSCNVVYNIEITTIFIPSLTTMSPKMRMSRY
mmetsp:Transcript_60771/g.144639  ORF Transcript_60771/g.144639 Transcript_60771/m.144639 type:complete len:203 (-) Transcript_60771:263-871(-)